MSTNENSHGFGASHDDNHHHTDNPIAPLLTVADFNGDGQVDITDIQEITEKYRLAEDEGFYHPLYDLNTDGLIDADDLVRTIDDYGLDVPLLDQQIAQATQATMKYYGADGLQQALLDGYIPSTQEAMGHGVHYFNFALAEEIGNLEELDIERPLGLNFDLEGNLIAVYYLRIPDRLEATPDNPLAGLLTNPADDFPPASFDTLTAEDWHTHESAFSIGLGNLDPRSVYYEEDIPFESVVSRLQQSDFQLFPESDQFYLPKFWMLHGWFHSLNSAGTFSITNPDVSPYAPEELGAHNIHHDGHGGQISPLITGTDLADGFYGTEENDRISLFNGDDWVIGDLGDDSIWGGQGNDWLAGDREHGVGGNDMLYGGPGNDAIYGRGGDDRIFGGTEDDYLVGGAGDDLIRGGLGYDNLIGNEGADSFVLVAGEIKDNILDFEIDLDRLVLYGGISLEDVSITQSNLDTVLSLGDDKLAILKDINAHDLIAASHDIFVTA